MKDLWSFILHFAAGYGFCELFSIWFGKPLAFVLVLCITAFMAFNLVKK